MINHIFILSQHRHWLSAKLARYCAWRASCGLLDPKNISILSLEDMAIFKPQENMTFRYQQHTLNWHAHGWMDFHVLRYVAIEKMHYQGKALILSPFAFAHWDIRALLQHDMGNNAICAQLMRDKDKSIQGFQPHILLCDAPSLQHWNSQEFAQNLFNGNINFHEFLYGINETNLALGDLEPQWNGVEQFFNIRPGISILYHEVIQPLRANLPFSRDAGMFCSHIIEKYQLKHNIEHLDMFLNGMIFARLREAIDGNFITMQEIDMAMQQGLLRHDAYFMLGLKQ